MLFNQLEKSIGETPILDSSGEQRSVHEIFRQNVPLIVGLLLVDTWNERLNKVVELYQKLEERQHEFAIIVVTQNDMPDSIYAQCPDTWYRASSCLTSSIPSLIRKFGLSFATRLPELLLLDPISGAPIATDGLSAIARETITKERFPNWRTNCVLVADAGTYYAPSVALHPERAIMANIFPGDITIVRRCGHNLSISVYVNPPDDTMHCLSNNTDSDVNDLPMDQVALPRALMHTLQVEAGDTVVLDGPLNPPEAESIVVRLEQNNEIETSISGRDVERSARQLFGLAPSCNDEEASNQHSLQKAAMLAAARGEDISELISALEHEPTSIAVAQNENINDNPWLSSYIDEQACRYIPVAQGDLICAPRFDNNSPEQVKSTITSSSQNCIQLRIDQTMPLGTVIVGPSTNLRIEL